MIDMNSKYDDMHKNEMFYTLICINSHVMTIINCMLSFIKLCHIFRRLVKLFYLCRSLVNHLLRWGLLGFEVNKSFNFFFKILNVAKNIE